MQLYVLNPNMYELVQKVIKYAKLCYTNFYIGNVGIIKRICVKPELQYVLSKRICKYLKFQTLIIIYL